MENRNDDMLREFEAELSDIKRERANMVNAKLSKYQILDSEDHEQKNCVICLEAYVEGEWVCALPCDIRH